jgi:tetratricopeptide (TPR) repeat protein
MSVEFLRKNGWMVGVLAVCLCAFGVGVVSLFSGGAAKETAIRKIRRPRPVASSEQDRAREILYTAKEAAPATTKREERLGYVEKYRRLLEETPDAPETPVTLLALGVTYRQLQDFENAAWAFQQIVDRFPQSNQYVQAWLELGTCYEFTGNHERMISTYMEMAKAFPPDTDACKFAQSKLRLLDVSVPGPVPEPEPEPEPGFVPDIEFESSSAVAAETAPAVKTAPVEAVAEEAAAGEVAVPAETIVAAGEHSPTAESPAPAR